MDRVYNALIKVKKKRLMTKPGIEPRSVCFLRGRATDRPTKV